MVQFDSPVRRKYGQGHSQELKLEDKEIFIKKNLCKCSVHSSNGSKSLGKDGQNALRSCYLVNGQCHVMLYDRVIILELWKYLA